MFFRATLSTFFLLANSNHDETPNFAPIVELLPKKMQVTFTLKKKNSVFR